VAVQYLVKPCVRGFGEMPTDAEYDAGELSLAVDDFAMGCKFCMFWPGCFAKLTVTAKVRQLCYVVQVVSSLAEYRIPCTDAVMVVWDNAFCVWGPSCFTKLTVTANVRYNTSVTDEW
jgi:hypothetical protein